MVDSSDLRAATRAVRQGGIVVVPTRRWYMVCCLHDRVDLANRMFLAKRRPRDKSLLLVPPSLDSARARLHFTPTADRLAAAFWPGELALRLDWNGEAPEHLGRRVLVSFGDDPLGRLAALVGAPLAATSANISGPDGAGPPITLAEAITFAESGDLAVGCFVDGGVCPYFEPLTIVRCPGSGGYTLERQGLVHERAIRAALDDHAQ